MAKAAVKNDLSLPDQIKEERAIENPVRPFQNLYTLTIKEYCPIFVSFSFEFVQVVTEFYSSLKVKIKLSIQKSLNFSYYVAFLTYNTTKLN